MEDQWGSIINNNRGSGVSLMMREGEEFQEVEVWDVLRKERENRGDFITKQRKSFSSVSSSSSSSSSSSAPAWRLALPSAPKMVIQRAKSWGNEGMKFSLQQSSAPVKIPDWSQIYEKNPKMGNRGIGVEIGYSVEDDEENEDEEMVPPHEYIARRLARSRIASHSMCEGIGRTLKGRDLCKLRNSILTQTGFLED